jgi:predicted DNA-binding transcriptional regulator YafY
MTRLTRLTNILLHLQSSRVVTAQELVDKFNITQRTIYRDIRASEEAGVPIIGEVGKGYSLADGYRIPYPSD